VLIHPTVDRFRALSLAAMADTLVELQNSPEAAEMPHADWLGLLVDREVIARDNRRLTRRLTSAKLRQAAAIENVDYRTARGLDRSLFQSLVTSQWIRDVNHLVIVGPTGTGKSWLACALGNKACRDGFSVLYKPASRLFADLAQPRRGPSGAPDRRPGTRQSAHPRRLGTRTAHRRPVAMARRHCRAHPWRCDIGPHHSQCAPPRAQRRQSTASGRRKEKP
jgi:hypothetical protein